MTRKVTIGIMISTVALWIVWDIYAAITPTSGDTESEIIRDYASSNPSLPFAVGVLMGHFFFNRDDGRLFSWSPWALAVIGSLVVIADVASMLPSIYPAIPFAIGVPFGALLWPQKTKAKEESDE